MRFGTSDARDRRSAADGDRARQLDPGGQCASQLDDYAPSDQCQQCSNGAPSEPRCSEEATHIPSARRGNARDCHADACKAVAERHTLTTEGSAQRESNYGVAGQYGHAERERPTLAPNTDEDSVQNENNAVRGQTCGVPPERWRDRL